MSVLVAMTAFILSHVIIVRTNLKPFLISKLGESGYILLYSILSVFLLAWVIIALLGSDRIFLWATPVWAYYFAAIFNLLGFMLIGIGFCTHNALSAAFRKSTVKNHSPFSGFVRHPIILGAGLWGFAHLPANGDLQSLILFGGSALFGILGMRIVDMKKQKELGLEQWQNLADQQGAIDKNTIIGATLGFFFWIVIATFLHIPLFSADPLILWR